MKYAVKIDMDAFTGVLYAKLIGKSPMVSRELPEDPAMFISFDSGGLAVGAILLCASDISAKEWLDSTARTKFPQDLRDALDRWFSARKDIGIDHPYPLIEPNQYGAQ